MPMISDCEEDLDDQKKTKTERPNLWLEHIAQSHLINGQQEVGSRRRFHHFLMDERPGLSMKSQLMTGWILQCLKQKNEALH